MEANPMQNYMGQNVINRLAQRMQSTLLSNNQRVLDYQAYQQTRIIGSLPGPYNFNPAYDPNTGLWTIVVPMIAFTQGPVPGSTLRANLPQQNETISFPVQVETTTLGQVDLSSPAFSDFARNGTTIPAGQQMTFSI
jgi:hypothetical protein